METFDTEYNTYKIAVIYMVLYRDISTIGSVVWPVSWSNAYSIVPWGDAKCIPALGRGRMWADPVVRWECWCDRLVGSEHPGCIYTYEIVSNFHD